VGDRRVRRTRERLRQALAEAIVAKGYEQVRVRDVLDRADVARSTFYAHFSDKDDLLRSGHDELRSAIAAARTAAGALRSDAAPPRLSCALVLFRLAARHADLYRAMSSSRGERRGGERFVADMVREDLAAYRAHGRGREFELLVHTVASALSGVIRWWLDQDIPCSAEELDREFHEIVAPGIARYLDTGGLPTRWRE
jgi:AcrR family transcriptional regulator